ncbi:ribonuclease H-like domain-containing protein [Tanacetum coccineum]|uniref:Ribonuclease H-like domain-containing protein n=1 Tax=Tanacetum coccineum TaxID=301880 RepID=A0ABQ4YXY7_9ASTR
MSVHGCTDDEFEHDDQLTLISKLDVSNLLHLHPNDSATLTVISVKLNGTENYQVWSCAMLLALEGKNKTGFIDGSYKRSNIDEVLGRQWDKHCGFNDHTIERVFKLIVYPVDFGKRNNNNNNNNQTGQNFSGRFVNNNSVSTGSSSGSSSTSSFSDEHILKLNANMAARLIVDSGANQDLTYTNKFLVNVINISKLKIKVSHPNGTEALITKVGNMKLTEHLTLYDVLVVPEYCASLMCVHKVARDNKFVIAFDESHCYVLPQDLREMKVLGIGKQKDGLYYFDGFQSNNLHFEKNRCTCNLTKEIWHCRLGHPSDQVMTTLKNDIVFEKTTDDKYCEMCQKAKQTRDPFSLSDHSTNSLGEIAYLSDEWKKSLLTCFLRKPSLSHLRTFGYLCFATILTSNDKFSSRSKKCVLVGYLHGSNGSADEGEMAATSVEHLRSSEGIAQNIPSLNFAEQVFQPLRRFDRVTVLPKKCNDYVMAFKVKFKDRHLVETMNNEMNALYNNDTWEITELPKGRKAIGSNWLFRNKYKSNGEIERYKARLVAKGFNLKEGIDFDEAFSPVVKIVTFRCLINLAVQNSWPLFQLDINNAFLYGDLSETVYMSLHDGYFDKNDNRSKSDYSLLTKSDPGMFLALLVYVDDIIITGNSLDNINEFKIFLKNLLFDFGLLACKPSAIPLEKNLSISTEPKENDYVLDKMTEYEKLIGKLIYLTHTRPDISYVVHCLSQFLHKPLKSHLKIALKVLRYLKGSPKKGVHIVRCPKVSLETFMDADWANCLVTRKSVTRFC